MPYLRIQPDTYKLARKQMFMYDKCQFCGCEDWNLRFYQNNSQKAESSRGQLRDILARRWCNDCNKTTALIKQ